VAAQCADWKLDAQALMAALLHDAMEDCGITKADLIERFGAQVADLVDGLTKLGQAALQYPRRKPGRVFSQDAAGDGARCARDSDQAGRSQHNMRTLSNTPRRKMGRIASETLEIYAPIAHRLGLNQTYRELQDLSFRHLRPWRYKRAGQSRRAGTQRRRDLIQKVQA
jgi:guanosine-3',5'-bis(diphosphate) 3'-pyrophosphohydrolase